METVFRHREKSLFPESCFPSFSKKPTILPILADLAAQVGHLGRDFIPPNPPELASSRHILAKKAAESKISELILWEDWEKHYSECEDFFSVFLKIVSDQEQV